LGPAGADLLSAAARDAFAAVPPEARLLRTARHPAADAVEAGATFDHRYEAAATMDEVYGGIVDDLVAAAARHGRVVYGVPGSPLVAERTVELLRLRAAAGDLTLDVVPGLSFLDLAWARLGIDPLAAGVRLVDGHRFAVEAAGERGPLLVAQTDSSFALSEVKLAVEDGPIVTVLQRLGLPDERVVEVAWADLDREVDADHLTTVWVPRLAAPVAGELQRLSTTVRMLRERCPWDRQQTHQSLTRYAVEEAYEVVEAIDALGDDPGDVEVDALSDELGDLLFQVVLHATIAEQAGWFTLADVAAGVDAKLVRRHPHVFDGLQVADADEVVRNWDAQKRLEQPERRRPLDGLPLGLPALQLAAKALRRSGALDAGAVASEGAAGDELLDAVQRLGGGGLDLEAALRRAVRRRLG
ncbi:MAG: MazG nucleotide pyrophosphohydrolase domain-containing protein, partial [Acidimicrobiales bacterium]